MANSDLNSTMTNMDDMASPSGGGSASDSAPTGISKLRAKLKNAFSPDNSSSGSKDSSGSSAPAPNIYSGIQSTMRTK